MLAVVLKILSILGIILLILLGIAVFLLLIVLFLPIVYKVDAKKTDTELVANARARWLFGLLRVMYHYPEPGNIIVKVLWKTVYDSGKKVAKKEVASEKDAEIQEGTEHSEAWREPSGEKGAKQEAALSQEVIAEVEQDSAEHQNVSEEQQTFDDAISEEQSAEPRSLCDKLFAKYEKIKYTIQQFCDKIKHIRDNITFYKKLLQDEQTKLLLSHVLKRLGKILRHIRPRKLKADVIFGADSPDTTGYVYGVYSIFAPQLGKNVVVTPDFTQKIFLGEARVAGHITIFTLLINVLAVLLDKCLRILMRRLKKHSARQNAAAEATSKASDNKLSA